MLTTPTFLVELRKPTLGSARTPAALRLRREVEYHDVTSGFRNRVLEAEASITDPSNTHSVSYTCSWRNLLPLRSAPGKLFSTASSPEVVANCDASLKSSVAYSYARSALNAGSTPSAGHKAVFRAELAGAGGDVEFARAAFTGLWAASLLRFAPDTGFALPRHQSSLVASVNGQEAGQQQQQSDDYHHQALRPHPGPWVLGLWGRALTFGLRASDPPVVATRPWDPRTSSLLPSSLPSSSSSSSYTLAHRIAGWLSPGITALADLSLGGLVPFGRSAERAYGSRIVDRFFLNGSRFRGFDSVGPKADPVEGGTPQGDVLGGDVLAAVTARLLLPPPLPSVRLANAGVRTQVFASVGSLALAKDAKDPSAFLSRCSAAAGVGLVSEPNVASARVQPDGCVGGARSEEDRNELRAASLC